MLRVAEVARIWQAAGVSIIPILDNQTKRPAFRWSPFQAVAPTLDQVDEWWGNGKPYGLALICGAVSGNLEMAEIEGRAMASDKLIEIINRMDELGVGHIWDLLYGPDGFTETSPSGGLHFLYRISDHEVPGNTKIARRPATEEELLKDPQDKLKVLAETRGHGGYVITAPTPGICHPSGEPWTLREGQYGKLPTITWQERCSFHEALHLALNQETSSAGSAIVLAPTMLPVSPASTSTIALTPGNDFEASTDWAEILEPHGWSLESRHGPERHWTRPGKDRREGASATTGRAGDRDRLYVFSTSTLFQSEVPYTKFGAFALLNHGGDHHAAARELVRRGFGERRAPVTLDAFVVEPPPQELEQGSSDANYTFDDVGNGMRLADAVRDTYRYIWEEKSFYRWSGQVWLSDVDGGMTREMVTLTDRMREQALVDEFEPLTKWAKASRSASKITAAVNMSKAFGLTHSGSAWNPNRHLLNVRNGVLNLRTNELVAHDRSYLMTKMFGANYDPGAECPEFEKFIKAAIPDDDLRTYVQRALGYSLLGDADQRSMFVIFGPSGTGKSTLMDTMRELFNDYGITAPAGTFRSQGRDKAPNNDLHALRGSRFVTTSETAESASFDEDLLKRLTGRDRVQSRALYQEHQEWVPECTLWLATNHMPKFNSDDDAIWRRTKMIPFNTVFLGEGQVADMARTVLAPEADGILNWLLAGLQAYLEHGLDEPEALEGLAKEQRMQSDSVARFMDDRLADNWIVLEEGGLLRTSELYAMYMEWARQCGEKPLGNRRFINRIQSNFPALTLTKVGSHAMWRGVQRPAGAWLTGRGLTLSD